MKDKLKRHLFTAACAAAVLAALALIAYFSYILILQSAWNRALADLENCFRDARGAECVVSRGEVEIPADESVLDYYLGVITMPRSMATHYASDGAGGEDIRLRLPGTTVSFAPFRDGVSTVVRWRLDGSDYGFVLGGTMDYAHLERYFQNAARKAAGRAE